MIYVVQKGDTLEEISEKTGVPSFKIIYDNHLEDKKRLVPGQALLVLPENETGNLGAGMKIGGYVSPLIEPAVLEQALGALGELLVFSYGFTFEGKLIPPSGDEHRLICAARSRDVKTILVLTPFSKGAFNNQLIRILMENSVIQEKVIEGLLAAVADRGYAGVEVEFEYVLPENRTAYADFLGRLRHRMNTEGYRVSVAVPPKTADDQKGLLSEGTDYALLGENADDVFLMTCEWGYTYGPPMAVSPLDKVRQVVEYALERIPERKLIAAIPHYGYDWTMPYERGISRACLIGNEEAAALAVQNNSHIEYAQLSQTPWFSYWKSGLEHVVWFEDVRSISAKLKLVRESGLAGVRFRNIQNLFRANWLLLR